MNDYDYDYDYDTNELNGDSDKELDDYFLNDESTTYSKPPGAVYVINWTQLWRELLVFKWTDRKKS